MITEVTIREGSAEIVVKTTNNTQDSYENKSIELSEQDKAAIMAILNPYLNN